VAIRLLHLHPAGGYLLRLLLFGGAVVATLLLLPPMSWWALLLCAGGDALAVAFALRLVDIKNIFRIIQNS
jgi:hypothetical protein